MITTIRAIMFSTEPTELKLAIHRVGMLLIQEWIIIIKVVSNQT